MVGGGWWGGGVGWWGGGGGGWGGGGGGGGVGGVGGGGGGVGGGVMAAVRSGQLAGAALDVQRREPLPADDPLWEVPGISITPHIAAQSSPQTIALQFVQGWRCLQRGEAPHNLVDRERGY